MNALASSFADPADVRAYNRARARGLSDREAFAVGDNGVGCWGDFTAQLITPMCALPPEDMVAKFGSVKKAKHARVIVVSRETGLRVECLLADRMPAKKNIKNGCGIDLNPAAAKQLKLKPPFTHPVTWHWSDEAPCTCA